MKTNDYLVVGLIILFVVAFVSAVPEKQKKPIRKPWMQLIQKVTNKAIMMVKMVIPIKT